MLRTLLLVIMFDSTPFYSSYNLIYFSLNFIGIHTTIYVGTMHTYGRIDSSSPHCPPDNWNHRQINSDRKIFKNSYNPYRNHTIISPQYCCRVYRMGWYYRRHWNKREINKESRVIRIGQLILNGIYGGWHNPNGPAACIRCITCKSLWNKFDLHSHFTDMAMLQNLEQFASNHCTVIRLFRGRAW